MEYSFILIILAFMIGFCIPNILNNICNLRLVEGKKRHKEATAPPSAPPDTPPPPSAPPDTPPPAGSTTPPSQTNKVGPFTKTLIDTVDLGFRKIDSHQLIYTDDNNTCDFDERIKTEMLNEQNLSDINYKGTKLEQVGNIDEMLELYCRYDTNTKEPNENCGICNNDISSNLCTYGINVKHTDNEDNNCQCTDVNRPFYTSRSYPTHFNCTADELKFACSSDYLQGNKSDCEDTKDCKYVDDPTSSQYRLCFDSRLVNDPSDPRYGQYNEEYLDQAGEHS
jgi:hypothetical protein